METKTKILIVVFVILFVFGLYFIYATSISSKNNTNKKDNGKDCPDGKDSDGNCKKGCFDRPKIIPNGKGQTCKVDSLICDETLLDWRCPLSPCENVNNKIPNNVGSCNILDIQCDSGNNTFFCHDDSTICGGHGSLYNGSTCVCDIKDGEQYWGDTCQHVSNCVHSNELNSKTGECTCKTGDNSDGCTFDRSKCGYHGTPDKNGNCICDSDYQGVSCQCKISVKPDTDEPCKGISTKCGPDGWETTTSTTCSDLYGMNGGSIDSWTTQCKNNLCSTDYTYDLKCSENQGKVTYECNKQCSDKPGVGDCQGCWDEKGGGSYNEVCACGVNGDTDYKWKCVSPIPEQCPSSKAPNICNSGESAQCVTCGSNHFTWQCSGSKASKECIVDKYQIYADKTNTWYTTTDQSGTSTVFPTIDNSKCVVEEKTPYSLLDNTGSDYGWTSFNSKPGFIDSLIDKNNINFTLRDDPNIIVYNTTNKDTGVFRTLHNLQEVAIDNDTGCMKKKSEFCSGQGDFTQYCFYKKDGTVADCSSKYDTTKGAILRTDSGSCICKTGWNGYNCEYSDTTTCNGHGTVNNDGTCNCTDGWNGNNCSIPPPCPKTEGYECNGRGTCDKATGLCKCDPEVGGPGCDCSMTLCIASPDNCCSGLSCQNIEIFGTVSVGVCTKI